MQARRYVPVHYRDLPLLGELFWYVLERSFMA